jgi:subtilisin family serine protease
MPRRIAAFAALVFVVAVLPAQAAPSAAGGARLERFIVTLDSGTVFPAAVAHSQARGFGGSVGFVYRNALKGYSITLPAAAAAALARLPGVESVVADGIATTMTTSSGAAWGIDRIDQRALPLSTTFSYTNTGAGVKAYIIDTGIRATHTQFGGRVLQGTDKVDNALPAADCNGHGTHVAGTVGGSAYGVAKTVTLVAVRVLNCSGSGAWSQVIAGIDWVTGDHQAGQPAVANMSLGGGANSAVDTAVQNSIADGVTYGIAAGNGNWGGIGQNACNSSPARVAQAITVGATNSTDTKASWSNYGSCVDLFAPGVNITSAWATSDTATNTISGTSMATPHVVGVAALYLQSNKSASPATVAGALSGNATNGVVKSAGSNSPNKLLFTSY